MSSSSIPPLPSGYKLQGEIPPLPNGYKLQRPPNGNGLSHLMGNGMPTQEDINGPHPSAFADQAFENIKDAAKSMGKVLRVGGGTIAKMALGVTPGEAIRQEAEQQRAEGGIPNSKDIVMQPLRELTGQRQPGESVTLGFTGHSPDQQPLLTRTTNAMSSIMGGNPAGAREHFSAASTAEQQGNKQKSSAENQRGVADLTAVPIATVGLGRLLKGAGAETEVRELPQKTAITTPFGVSDTLPSGIRQAASDALNKSAQADLGKVLAPTKQSTKYVSKNKVIPGMQERRIVARSADALQKRAAQNIENFGQKIDEAYDAMPEQSSIPTQPIIDRLESYKNNFINEIPGQNGRPGKAVVMDQGAVNRINEIQDMIREHGDTLDPQSLRKLRQFLDERVSQGQGYHGKTLAEGQTLDIQREAANAIRGQLAQSVPGLADLNAEYSFWKNLNDVLEETAKRRTGQQGGGLGRKIAAGTGTVIGAKVGGPAGALIGQKAGDYLSQLTNSTAWNTVKANLKTRLAARAAPQAASEQPKSLIDIIRGNQTPPEQPATTTPSFLEMMAGQPERRVKYPDLRQELSKMSPQDQQRAIFISDKTSLPNKRAFNIAESHTQAPATAMSDADGLKAFNDKFGYAAGDELLKAKADALRKAGLEAYHDKGDEFLFRGESTESLQSKLEKARDLLQERVIEVKDAEGKIRYFKGADFSYGTGENLQSAEAGLKNHKQTRISSGERARGELRGIVEVGPGGSPINQNPTGNRSLVDLLNPKPIKKGRK